MVVRWGWGRVWLLGCCDRVGACLVSVCGMVVVLSARWVCCGRAGPRGWVQVVRRIERRSARAVVKRSAHGHRVGSRNVNRPLRFTSLAGIAKCRVRIVRVTVS